jgi:hypothetical protein
MRASLWVRPVYILLTSNFAADSVDLYGTSKTRSLFSDTHR